MHSLNFLFTPPPFYETTHENNNKMIRMGYLPSKRVSEDKEHRSTKKYK